MGNEGTYLPHRITVRGKYSNVFGWHLTLNTCWFISIFIIVIKVLRISRHLTALGWTCLKILAYSLAAPVPHLCTCLWFRDLWLRHLKWKRDTDFFLEFLGECPFQLADQLGSKQQRCPRICCWKYWRDFLILKSWRGRRNIYSLQCKSKRTVMVQFSFPN